MSAKVFFEEKLPKLIKADPEKVSAIDAVYAFNINGDGGGEWTVDLKANPPTVAPGQRDDNDCSVEISNEDFASLIADSSQGMQLFMQGRLKVSDPMLATKLAELLALA